MEPDRLGSGSASENTSMLMALLNRLRGLYDEDPEAAQSLEARITSRVLQLTAEGHPQATEFAAVVLAVEAWDVERWFA